MANKTKAQRYNENLERLCRPEINRLSKIVKVSHDILSEIRKYADIPVRGDNDCWTINAITKIIDIYLHQEGFIPKVES